MKKAIDNYSIGKQKEVTAWEGESIPASSNRFFCPECLESVALDIRGHFRHKNRTEQSIECERRIDNPSRTPYERMGLPFYIVEVSPNTFNLKIGFPAIPYEFLIKATRDKSYVEFMDGGFKKKMFITSDRFNNDGYTLIDLDRKPIHEEISISYSDNTPRSIRAEWSNHSDNWGKSQFFKSGIEKSRKIRRLGSIVLGEEYFFVGDAYKLKMYPNVVSIHKYGTLSFKDGGKDVYKIIISQGRYKDELSKFAEFLKMEYKLNLSLKDSSIVPIWPPCLEDDNYYLFNENCKYAVFYVNSPNDEPEVFKYSGTTYETLPVNKKGKILKLKLSENEIPISVDRAFNGNIQYIKKQEIKYTGRSIRADLLNNKGVSLICNNNQRKIEKTYSVVSDAPAKVLMNKKNGQIMLDIDTQDGLTISDLNWGDNLIVYTRHWNKLLDYCFIKESTENDFTRINIKSLNKPPFVDIDNHIVALCKTYMMKNVHDPDNLLILKYLREKRIPVQVVKYLQKLKGAI